MKPVASALAQGFCPNSGWWMEPTTGYFKARRLQSGVPTESQKKFGTLLTLLRIIAGVRFNVP